MIESVWHGCYDQTLKGIITPESFRHPAKMGKVLCERIFDHGNQMGYWQPGDVIGESFGGIFTVGILGSYRGYQVIGVELEPHFHDLGLANIDKNLKKLNHLGKPIPILVQGDSRQFAEIIRTVLPFIGAEHAAGVVTSPPYMRDHGESGIDQTKLNGHTTGIYSQAFSNGYGDTSGQIGALDGNDFDQVSGVITSPPFSQPQTRDRSEVSPGLIADAMTRAYTVDRQGTTEGNIAALAYDDIDGVITSPPFERTLARELVDADARREYARAHGISNAEHVSVIDMERTGARDQEYGNTAGQIGVLSGGEIDGAITSPPYADQSIAKSSTSIDYQKQYETYRSQGGGASFEKFVATQKLHSQEYGTADGQIGVLPSRTDDNNEKETYWQAMAQVYQQIWLALKPGGVAAIVVKDYIRNKQRVLLCDQTASLLERLGFTIVERTRAMLVKEQAQASLMQIEDTSTTTTNLLGDTSAQVGAEIGEVAVSERVERLSFFRRLHGKKYPHLKIEWEEVIWAQKPGQNGGGIEGVVTSPPYGDGSANHGGNINNSKMYITGGKLYGVGLEDFHSVARYGETPGQIGQLKEGDIPT